MIRKIKCPKCGNEDDSKFSILGYTNLWKVPSIPSSKGSNAIVKCESKPCQHEFEVLVK